MRLAGGEGAATVFAGGHTAGQRRPAHQPHIQFQGHGQEFRLAGPFDDAVLKLGGNEGIPAVRIGQGIGAGDPPGREIRGADIEHFALPDQVVQSAQDFVGWGREVVDMDPQQINVVGAQALEAALDRADQVLAMIALGVGVVVVGSGLVKQRVFGRGYEPVPASFHELAQPGFRLAFLIAVGGVHEVAARLDKGVENPAALLFVGTNRSPVDAEGRATQTEFRNAQTTSAQQTIVHHASLDLLRFGKNLNFRTDSAGRFLRSRSPILSDPRGIRCRWVN